MLGQYGAIRYLEYVMGAIGCEIEGNVGGSGKRSEEFAARNLNASRGAPRFAHNMTGMDMG